MCVCLEGVVEGRRKLGMRTKLCEIGGMLRLALELGPRPECTLHQLGSLLNNLSSPETRVSVTHSPSESQQFIIITSLLHQVVLLLRYRSWVKPWSFVLNIGFPRFNSPSESISTLCLRREPISESALRPPVKPAGPEPPRDRAAVHAVFNFGKAPHLHA